MVKIASFIVPAFTGKKWRQRETYILTRQVTASRLESNVNFFFCQSMFFKIKKISCLIDAKYIICTPFVSLFFVKHT